MAKNFFTQSEQQQIVDSIQIAEKNTSGEIKVHIEEYCSANPFDRALEVFADIELHKTQLKNGVLFYMAVLDRKFAIVADEGINNQVPPHFWDDIKEQMKSHFKENQLCQGICKGILMAGEQLKVHFPYHHSDTNELSDDISFG
jgi:uncharacterized membrane protein